MDQTFRNGESSEGLIKYSVPVRKKIAGGMTTNPALALLTDIKHLIDEARQREATAALAQEVAESPEPVGGQGSLEF